MGTQNALKGNGPRSVQEVMDAEFIQEGLAKGIPEAETRRQLEESRRLMDLFCQEWATGRSVADINAEWESQAPVENPSKSG